MLNSSVLGANHKTLTSVAKRPYVLRVAGLTARRPALYSLRALP
jgi:hypothetical protein